MTDVAVSSLAIRCSAPARAADVASAMRTRLAAVAEGPLATALEAALGDMSRSGVDVIIDQLAVHLDFDPHDYDDDTIATLWAERIRSEVQRWFAEHLDVAGADRRHSGFRTDRSRGNRRSGSPATIDTAAGPADTTAGRSAGLVLAERLSLRTMIDDATSVLILYTHGDDRCRSVLDERLRRRGVGADETGDPPDASAGATPTRATEGRPELLLAISTARRLHSERRAWRDRAPGVDRSAGTPEPGGDRADATGLTTAAIGAHAADSDPSGSRPPTEHRDPTSFDRIWALVSDADAFVSLVGGIALLYPWLDPFLADVVARRTDLDRVDARRLALTALVTDEVPEIVVDPLVRLLAGDDLGSRVAVLDTHVDDATAAGATVVLRQFARLIPGFEQSSARFVREELLEREALLQRVGDVWHLELAPRPLDLLLDRLPYPLGVFRLPWTETISINRELR